MTEKAIGAAHDAAKAAARSIGLNVDTMTDGEITGSEIAVIIRAAIAAYEKAMWRPIEEAPKDEEGAEVILHGPVPENPKRVTAGFWLAPEHGKYLGDCGGECRCPEYGDAPEPFWMTQDGGFTDEYPATHFRPLPTPPEDI